MKYRSNKHDIDAGALMFIGVIILYVILVVCCSIVRMQVESNRHIEKMEQIKTCQEEEE